MELPKGARYQAWSGGVSELQRSASRRKEQLLLTTRGWLFGLMRDGMQRRCWHPPETGHRVALAAVEQQLSWYWASWIEGYAVYLQWLGLRTVVLVECFSLLVVPTLRMFPIGRLFWLLAFFDFLFCFFIEEGSDWTRGALLSCCAYSIYIRIMCTSLFAIVVGVYNIAISAPYEINWFYEKYTRSSIQQVGEKTDQSGVRNNIIGRFLEFAYRCPILFWWRTNHPRCCCFESSWRGNPSTRDRRKWNACTLAFLFLYLEQVVSVDIGWNDENWVLRKDAWGVIVRG